MIPRFAEPERILLWDLDGTIVDTSADLAAAINRMLSEYGYAPLPLPVVVGHVGKGAQNLVARCLEEYGHRLVDDPGSLDSRAVPADPRGTVAEALSIFERHYAAHLVDETMVYPAIGELLCELAGAGRTMAVVTNKPEGPSRKIIDHLGLSSCFAVVVGGETLPTRKPAPEPLLHAIEVCRRVGIPGSGATSRGVSRDSHSDTSRVFDSAVMIGDTWIDAQAARAAGLPVILVGWGLGDRRKAAASMPDAWAESATELRSYLLPQAPQE